MSDAVVEAATAAATGAPETAPTATETSAPTTPSADALPTFDDALAVYQATKAKNTAAEEPAVEAKTEAAPAETAEPKKEAAKELEAGDEVGDHKLARVFNRISRLEDDLKSARGETDGLKARAARADELEAEKALFLKDPEKFFKGYGWDQDTIRDYVVNGPKALKPEVAQQRSETQELRKQLDDLKNERRAEADAKQVAEAKLRIPAMLKPDEAKFPTLHSYYDEPGELADAIYGVINAGYQQQKTVLTVHEAAEAVEKVLSAQAKRFSRARSKEPEPSTKQPATKQPSPTLTNVPPATSNPPKQEEESEDSDNFAAALAVYKQRAKK